MMTIELSCEKIFMDPKNIGANQSLPVLVKEEKGERQIGFLKEGILIWMISMSENGLNCWGKNDIPKDFRDSMPHLRMGKLFFKSSKLIIEYLE